MPLALNLFTAVLAGLMLARSVALLRYYVPSDDPIHQRKPILAQLSGPYHWMPPTLAALVCEPPDYSPIPLPNLNDWAASSGNLSIASPPPVP